MIIAYIVLAILVLSLCYRFGDWKHWRLYYPTILYYIIGDLSCHILTYGKPLWLFQGTFMKHTFADYFVTFALFPSIIILFLSNYPKKIVKQVVFMLLFVIVLSLTEYIALVSSAIAYYNGWTSITTIFFYMITFPLLQIHYKKPIIAWIISVALAFIVLFIFKIPFESIR